MLETSAIVVVRDRDLAFSLELALLAAGLAAILHDPRQGLEALPLDSASTLIIDQPLVRPYAAAFIGALRSRPWPGLVILLTDDEAALRATLGGDDRVIVLEMPFQAADLIAAIRSDPAA